MAFFEDRVSYGGSRWSATTLAPAEAAVIKQSYMLLGLSVIGAMAGGYVGATSPLMVNLFSSWMGWIVALLIINILPRVAIAARHSGSLGVVALVADGFVSGLILAPILAIAASFAPDIIVAALMITALVFITITGFVMMSGRTFSPPRGLMLGTFVALTGAVVLNGFLQIGILGVAIAAGIGIFGVFSLVYATSDVLRSPEADSPIPGALMLFAGLFNVFVATLNILLALSGGRSRD